MYVVDKFPEPIQVYESFPDWPVLKAELEKMIDDRKSSYDGSAFFLDINTMDKAWAMYHMGEIGQLKEFLAENNIQIHARDKAGFDCFEHVWYPNDSDFALPSRGTPGSAGYDFMLPTDIVITNEKPVVVKLGVRWVSTDPNKFLMIKLRSKYSGMIDMQGSGIIDADYAYNKDTYGEISLVLRAYPGVEPITLKKGEYICQGIIMGYGKIAVDVPRKSSRVGGFGSTDKKEDDGIEEAVIVEE